mmetsp:Transcript_22425/g.50069  ORF Transcript_22425/g.50069 Transcript_22425/m.50069 type:complete len:595 (+) Transcript_22425:69-1853(+)|eukprot:CAMPEP_0201115954 /NCGR_PEP_ID=MMETSP0850-20130426/351_1 /ASSEMBLY_ACC=CAM_ASM_000622 /TAXON_ID=183588 /ORGANISM="Pseudo-nitzschia fraudulenta, Strain WWA7" /LENGTH=594 /DNA_ID=CAMNT_0047379893 /DNA_START=37 /DNA_END=1821 /DNA_ORIENTATION=-
MSKQTQPRNSCESNVAASTITTTTDIDAGDVPATAISAASDANTTASTTSSTTQNKTSSGKKNPEKIPTKKTNQSKHNSSTKRNTNSSDDPTTAAPAPAAKTIPEKATGTKKKAKKRVRKPRRIIPHDKEFIPEDEQPTQEDVVGGRGGRSNHHPGNRPYWIRILESRAEYTNCCNDMDKARIANGILNYVQQMLGGRFLNIDNDTKRWYLLPNAVVLDKIKQALRDKYVPFWARDLKIEGKKHDTVITAPPKGPSTEVPAGNNSNNINNINNTRINHNTISYPVPMHGVPIHGVPMHGVPMHGVPINGFNQMAPWGRPFVPPRNPNFDSYPPSRAMTTMNTSRVNGVVVPNFTGMVAPPGTTYNGKPADCGKNNKNKLDFLFSESTKRSPKHTAVTPTVDDILKCKVDQMPSFHTASNAVSQSNLVAAAAANASVPFLPTIGLNSFQSNIPGWLKSIAGWSNHGFGAGGNPGAPALPAQSMGRSMGTLNSFEMKSLENYVEHRVVNASMTALAEHSFPAAQKLTTGLNSLDVLKSLVSLDKGEPTTPTANSGSVPVPSPKAMAGGTTAVTPNGTKKTDWNAMYTMALTESKKD